MKLISLNVWGGRVRKPLLSFLEENQSVDIFCLQEVYKEAEGKETVYLDAELDIYTDIIRSLPSHNALYHPHLKDYYGLATFINSDIEVVRSGEWYVHKEKGYVPTDHVGRHAKNVSYAQISCEGQLLHIVNFHGLWNGKGKNDTDERLAQSEKIVDFLKTLDGNFILCGDFNLRPDTKSIELIESFGARNLIKEYNVPSTRTSFYEKPEKFADYIFVSQGVQVREFKVLSEEVSDHAALYIDFSVNGT